MLITVFLGSGLVLLYYGAEALVRGSGSLALRLGISPLIVGITVVAFGTSSPELIVSIGSALTGSPGIALGNVIGSNICNIALILGLAALIRPLEVQSQLVRIDVPIMIGCSLLLLLFLLDNALSRIEGSILLLGITAYIAHNIRAANQAKKKTEERIAEESPISMSKLPMSVLMALLGLAFLAGGAHLFVRGAVLVAEQLGISKAVIGLTIVAFGTSLPELATSVVAAVKGVGDISIGNVIGSNIFNILVILGITATIHPLESSDISWLDLCVMMGIALIDLPIMRTGHRISRGEGAFLLVVYVAYTLYLIAFNRRLSPF